MKNALSLLLLLALLCGLSLNAAADAMPTIDQVLSAGELPTESIEVSDDLSEYDPDALGEVDYGTLQLIILTRAAPEKEYTKLDSGYPDSMVDGFPDDYSGVDLGAPRVWLRCDLMRQLPSQYRAASLAEADVLIIAENEYVWAGTLVNTTYEDSAGDQEPPEFETTEELREWLAAHSPRIESICYYPKFGVYSLINLYDTGTKTCTPFDYLYTQPLRFAKNPEASDQWENMTVLLRLLQEAAQDTPDAQAISAALEEIDFVTDTKKAVWSSCLEAQEYSTLFLSADEVFWDMAEALRLMDPSADNQANYRNIIDAQDYGTLYLFAEYCEYSSFDRSIESIGLSKDYLADYDTDWMEAKLQEFLSLFAPDPQS